MLELVGNGKATTPQRVKEVVYENIKALIIDQPLDLVIAQLETLLRNSKHEKLMLKASHSYQGQTRLYLEGIRSETEEEVKERLERERSYVKRDIELKLSKISSLEKELASLREAVDETEKKLNQIGQPILEFDSR